jgi:hypothetical protein
MYTARDVTHAPKYSPNLAISEHVSSIAAMNGRLSFTRAFKSPFELTRFDIKCVSALPVPLDDVKDDDCNGDTEEDTVDPGSGRAQSKHDNAHKNSRLALSSTKRWKQHNTDVARAFLRASPTASKEEEDKHLLSVPLTILRMLLAIDDEAFFFSISLSLASAAAKTNIEPNASRQ